MGVYKRGIAWWIDFYAVDPTTGKRVRVREPVGSNKRVAEQALLSRRHSVLEGTFQLPENVKITFSECLDQYLSYSRRNKSPSSYKRDITSSKRLKLYFNDIQIKSITPKLIEKYIDERKESKTYKGTPPTFSTINRELALLKHLLNRARRDEYIPSNPMKLVRMLRENKARDIVISSEQFQSLLKHSAPHLKPILLCAYHTAMRLGEIQSLEWSSVNLKIGRITLKPEDTKTREKRVIPINLELAEVLRKLRRKSLKNQCVFTNNGKPITSFRTAFENARNRANLAYFRFHDLRHTAITNWRRVGVHDSIIMKWSGHKTMAMFLRYNTVDDSDYTDAIIRVNEYNDGHNMVTSNKNTVKENT